MANVKINGDDKAIDAPGDTPLLWAVRDLAGLTGTKYGCGIGQCGACTVHVDGKAERSCVLTLDDVAGKEVTTIEGLSDDGNHPVQAAWRELNVPQCGFCQAGQIMQAASLLSEKTRTRPISEILDGMAGKHLPLWLLSSASLAAVRQAATGI